VVRPHLASPKERNNAQPSWPHPDLLQKRRPSEHSPRFSEILITIGNFENGGQRYKDDVVVMKFGFAMEHRSFSFGEGDGG
jgi:hypothetical protein